MRDPLSECQPSDENDSSASIEILDRLGFNPFGELVDCHKYMSEAAPTRSQRSNHVQTPNNEGPDEWNGLQGSRRLVRHV